MEVHSWGRFFHLLEKLQMKGFRKKKGVRLKACNVHSYNQYLLTASGFQPYLQMESHLNAISILQS
jgi:hypothetical protein